MVGSSPAWFQGEVDVCGRDEANRLYTPNYERRRPVLREEGKIFSKRMITRGEAPATFA